MKLILQFTVYTHEQQQATLCSASLATDAGTYPLTSNMLSSTSHSLRIQQNKAKTLKNQLNTSHKELKSKQTILKDLEKQNNELKAKLIDSKLAFDKAHQDRLQKERDLKAIRDGKNEINMTIKLVKGALDAIVMELTKQRDEHKVMDASVDAMTSKLELLEKEMEQCKKEAVKQAKLRERYLGVYDGMRRDLCINKAAQSAVSFTMTHSK